MRSKRSVCFRFSPKLLSSIVNSFTVYYVFIFLVSFIESSDIQLSVAAAFALGEIGRATSLPLPVEHAPVCFVTLNISAHLQQQL